ncbi:MAG: hypothetical protein KF779_16690 [Hyphomonadaceae bacterium]|nr:hypothetical protein [Hyphomonadaceae bacterium]
MRFGMIAVFLSAAALGGCATGQGMGHQAMSHEEMMQHCRMMEQHQGQGGHNPARHDPAQHGGMSHEEMMQHCAAMQHDASAQESASPERLEAVAQAGAQVMPFDLERTTHSFRDRAWGGEQIVVSDDGDAQQVALIRAHLSAEAMRFSRGDFGGPEAIHGHDMPGLAVLRDQHAAIDVAYSEVPNGASITYRSQDSAVVGAIHEWFEAQRTDHGAHASH